MPLMSLRPFLRDLARARVRSAVLCLLLGGLLFAAMPRAAQSQTLSSEHLEIRFQAEPYGFEVVETASGETLLTHAETAFREGTIPQTVQEAYEVNVEGNVLTAQLDVAGLARAAHLRLELTPPRRVTIELDHPSPDASVSVAFTDEGQHYYGVWEQTHGEDLDLRGADHAFVGRDYQHEQVYAASIRAPFYMMSNGLGVYAETQASGDYAFAREDTTRFTFQTGELKYHLLYGPSYKQILSEYNKLAGPPDMPPLWALSSIWWRNDHHHIPEQVDVENAQELLFRDVEMLEEYRIPSATMWIDRPFTTGEWGWGGKEFDSSFPDPDAMVQRLRENGMHLLYWITGRTENELEAGLREKGLLFEGYTDRPSGDLRQTEANLNYKD